MPRAARRGSRALVATTPAAVTITARMTRAGVTGRFERPASGCGRLQVGVRRGLQDSERGEGPVAEERAPDDVPHGDRAEGARVRRALAVVAHHEQLVGGDHPTGLVTGLGRLGDPLVVLVPVRLVERRAVDVHEAVVAYLDGVPGQADHALDEWGAVRGPLRRRVE